MKRHFFISLTILFFVLSCHTVPITGRQQLSIVSSETLMSVPSPPEQLTSAAATEAGKGNSIA